MADPFSKSDPARDPVLYLGLDLAVKRDSSALSAWYKIDDNLLGLWGSAIWPAPVDLINQVEPALFWVLEHHRVAALLYDPYQFATIEQRLIEKGYQDLLVEVNQQTMMLPCSNTLHSHIYNRTVVFPKDAVLRAHYASANARHGERGWRIIKSKQSRQIDGVVADAMGLWGATQEVGHTWHPSFDARTHVRTLMSLP
jgi:phage terminase large subunit-like protein